MTAGALLLAAGSSRRFGSDKRLAELAPGQTLLEASAQTLRDAGIPTVICVAAADQELAVRLQTAGFIVELCARAAEGMGATLGEAAGRLPSWDAVLIALGDMPWVRPASLRSIVAMARRDRIVVPVFEERAGHPVAFGARYFRDLANCSGDRGARRVIEKYPDAVQRLQVQDPGIHRDVDTPAMLRRSDDLAVP